MAGFPMPKICGGAWVDLGRRPPLEEEESGSNRWPPRGKLYCLIADRSRPSEHRESKRDCGGLLSSTINMERSLLACKGRGGLGLTTGYSSGMQDARFTSTVGCIITWGRSHGVDKGVVVCNGAVDPGRSGGCSSWVLEDGFSCMGVWCGVACIGVSGCVASEVFSCKLESDNAGGAVRSKVVAAQSQWVDREP